MGMSVTTACALLEKMAEGTSESPRQAEPRTEAECTEASTSSPLLDHLQAPQTSDLVRSCQLKSNLPVSYAMSVFPADYVESVCEICFFVH